MTTNFCGIDEAGRGCLAGDLAVAGVILKHPIEGLNDSKKLTAKKREELSILIKENSFYHIVLTPSAIIDKIGLSKAIKNSILEIMNKLDTTNYLMDGNTSFGIDNLQTMVKADLKVKEVSAASILAKVARDYSLLSLNSSYDKYQFHTHKGYGTKKHIELIKEFGLSDMHRKSFKIKQLDS